MKPSYPTLAQLFGCYLHQDWLEEFDTAADAVAAFMARSLPEARKAAHDEVERLLTQDLKEAKLLAQLEKLGCYYWPAGDGLTARQWLAQVAKQLDAS